MEARTYPLARRCGSVLLAATMLFVTACGGAPQPPAASTAPTVAPTTAPAATSAPAATAAPAANPTAEAPAAPAEPITIRFRTPRWASTQDQRVERQIAFRSVIESFNQQYAAQGIQVEEVVADDNSVNITQDVEQRNVDVYWFNHSEYANRMRAGQLLDLTPYLNDADKAFFPWVQETLRSVDPTMVGALWHNTDTPLYYYNTEKIPTPPKTWSELRAVAERIRAEEGEGVYGVSIPIVGWAQFNTGMFMAQGGEFVDESGAPVLFEGENREILKSMFEFYGGLINDGLIPASSVTNDQQQQMPDVYAGTVYSFFGNSNFHVRQLLPNLPPEEYAKWAAVPLPYPDAAGRGMYQAGGWMIGAVPSGDAARDAAAAAFVIHATGPSAMAATTRSGAWIPTRPEVLSSDPFFNQDPFAQTTLAALEQGHVVPLQPVFIPMVNAVQTALQRYLQGEVTVDEAIAEAEAETMREYEAIRTQQ